MAGAVEPARVAQHRLEVVADVFRGLETGALTTNKAGILAALHAVNIDLSPEQSANVGAVQKAVHENISETLQNLKDQGHDPA